MSKKRVLLFSAQQLLGESIEQTLRGVADVEIAGHWPVDDQVMQRLASAEPDVVIFTDEAATRDSLSCLMPAIMEQYPELHVFRVSLERNQVQILTSQLVPARSANLIELIQHMAAKNPGAE